MCTTLSSSPFPDLPEMQKLKALLAVAECRAKRDRDYLARTIRESHNDHCYFALACALMSLKNEYNYSWADFCKEIQAPCSIEMVKSVALRRKSPSIRLYNQLATGLRLAALRNGYAEPNLPTPEGA